MANFVVALLALLALIGSAAAQWGPCAGDGSYHLSCYARTISTARAIAAKNDCFKAWKNPACKAVVRKTYSSQFGCGTAITYSFATDACRDAYQAQEKTNRNCVVYRSAKLGDTINRQTAKVIADYKCPTPGPCGKAVGAYHLSCYKKAVTPAEATASKVDCFKAWNNPGCKAAVVATFTNSNGCDTAITYSFATVACRDSYQKQEKTNAACDVYKRNGLGLAANRQSAFVQSDYTCPNPGPCPVPGAYHISCYARSVTPANANLAKVDCFRAWNRPLCKPTVRTQLTNLFGCDTLIGYSFTTAACRDAYQKQEKTNAQCDVYKRFGLGSSANRKTTNLAADYTCPFF